jgi:hypothetical protein
MICQSFFKIAHWKITLRFCQCSQLLSKDNRNVAFSYYLILRQNEKKGAVKLSVSLREVSAHFVTILQYLPLMEIFEVGVVNVNNILLMFN